jgi:hypothetical protein
MILKIHEEVRLLELKCEAFKKLFYFNKTVPMTQAEFFEYRPYLQILDLNQAWGTCPFPEQCNRYDVCKLSEGCNADTCSNGNAYRMS